MRRPSSQCEYLVLQAPLELEELVDGEVALPVLSKEEGDEAGVDALKEERNIVNLSKNKVFFKKIQVWKKWALGCPNSHM